MLNNREAMIHVAALEQVMKTITREARVTLSNATPPHEAVKRLEEVVRVHPYAVLFADNTGRYIGANAAAIELTGFSRRELLAASVFDITPQTDERDVALLWRAFLRIGRQDGDIVIRRRDGSHVSGRYMAATNVFPGVHVSVLAKI
jgi:PAS domain S-box-containing protein